MSDYIPSFNEHVKMLTLYAEFIIYMWHNGL